MSSVLQKLTEGMQTRNLQKEGAALVAKWEETGLLEGLRTERMRNNMALLLENQAKELLREASTMSAGDVEGFAAVAFPLVRRSFGQLIANEVVSVQPMSLPSGLIFFLDFQHNSGRLGAAANDSVYGGGRVGYEITGGVSLVGANIEKSFYNLNNGYSSPTGSATVLFQVRATGGVGGTLGAVAGPTTAYDIGDARLLRADPDIASGTFVVISTAPKASFTNLDNRNWVAITATLATPSVGRQARRLVREDPINTNQLMFVLVATGSENIGVMTASFTGSLDCTFPEVDVRQAAGHGSLGAIVGTTPWGLENVADIPELDIKVDSISIEAETKKLKAKWTPELQQDIQAYQNLDAEVELTSILSEHISLEIDQELLEDLVKGATAGTYWWSRRPGRFLTRDTGAPISSNSNESILGADFTGNVSEWYETLLEVVNDISAQIHRKTLKGGANFLIVGPEVANILEMTHGFRASVSGGDSDPDYTGEAGVLKSGTINKKWDIYVDPYFPRNVILCGRKGSSFLESGYVFAPYVPLQVTPTIYGQEDFVPRKGVMTRFGREMVKPDFYGLVIVQDLLG